MPNQDQSANAVDLVTYRDTPFYLRMILLPNRELMQANLSFSPSNPFNDYQKQEEEESMAQNGMVSATLTDRYHTRRVDGLDSPAQINLGRFNSLVEWPL